MKEENIIKIRRMPEQELKKFEKRRQQKAYQISFDNFQTYFNVLSADRIGEIVAIIKKYRNIIWGLL